MQKFLLYLIVIIATLIIGAGLGWLSREVIYEMRIDNEVRKPEPYRLPDRIVQQQESPDRVHVAQILHHTQTQQYFLALKNQRHQTRLLLEKALLAGPAYHSPLFKLAWRGNRDLYIEIDDDFGDNKAYYHFDLMFLNFARLAQAPREFKAAPPTSATTIAPVVIDTLEQKLLLYQQIPAGVDYSSLKQALPQLSELKSQNAREGLAEALLEMEVFGQQVVIDFNFKHQQLYSYYYRATLQNAQQAETLYRQLQDFYRQNLGEYQEEQAQESEHYGVVNSIWQTDTVELGLVNNLSPGSHSLSWGFKY